ncbi:hypothetical protein SDC9_162344 [bioreactor metagenome]|uniref:Uncharacterized protein n=1 Tax=bioreactor metagenome TaxID=1076179 RepID=A0A645FKU1_9ZZZZ
MNVALNGGQHNGTAVGLLALSGGNTFTHHVKSSLGRTRRADELWKKNFIFFIAVTHVIKHRDQNIRYQRLRRCRFQQVVRRLSRLLI